VASEGCECGSGLKRVHCCGADPAGLPDEPALALLESASAEIIRLFNERKYTEAEAQALKILELAPNMRQPLRVLFEIRKAQNNMRAAEMLARRLAQLPGVPGIIAAANIQFAQLLVGQGRYADAQVPAGRAVIATPRDATAQHVMGVVLTETQNLAAGETHYRKALALLGRDDGLVLANLAWNLKLQGRLRDAAQLYVQALALRPENRRGLGGFAQVEFARGRRAEAIALLDDGLARWPEERTLRLLRAMAALQTGDTAQALALMADPPDKLLPAELCLRGQALARQGEPIEAIRHYATAKKLMRERNGLVYDEAGQQARADSYKDYFTADRTLPLPRAPHDDGPQPIFLLGFPRSGTALLEQLLAQLPGIQPADEASRVASLVERSSHDAHDAAPYPQVLDRLLVGQAQDLPAQWRAAYVASLRACGMAQRPRYVTDRNPANPWHLGLIKLLFPQAPMIHVIRHPLDVALSNFSQDRRLEGGADASIVTISKHYAMTMDLLRHYRGQLTLRYLPVRYEDLVTAPRTTLSHILTFIGAAIALPDELVLRANDAPLPEPTPAHFATREAVHGRGLYPHRAYHAAAPNIFAEALVHLAPWIEEFGYGAAS
jgi:tetratricopeptide (TPR) repeat protein